VTGAHRITVQSMLDELAPGERRELKRTIEPTGSEGRFWDIAMDGRVAEGSLEWINKQYPSQDSREDPFVRMSDIEQPRLVAREDVSPIGDVYRLLNRIFFLAAPLVDCIRSLDPNAVEVRECISQGNRHAFYLVLITRRLDAIDVARTDLVLHNKRVLPDRDVYGKRVYYPRGLVLRDDVPTDVHCFSDVHSASIFFSTDLVACARAKRLVLFSARHPTGLGSFPESQSGQCAWPLGSGSRCARPE